MKWGSTTRAGRSGTARRLAIGVAGAALVLGMSSAGYAVGLLDNGRTLLTDGRLSSFTPASADPRMARFVAERSDGNVRFVRFTPAGTSDGASRSITVAVRVDTDVARAITVRSAIAAADEVRVASATGPRITPTRYNLGLARGYQSFARPTAAATTAISDAKIPDLAAFAPSEGVDKPSRFAARVQLEEAGDAAEPTTKLVRSSGQSITDQSLDVAGSYRLTRNLDVTAGVRYLQERERLSALPAIGEQDSQAVYIGTQFRF